MIHKCLGFLKEFHQGDCAACSALVETPQPCYMDHVSDLLSRRLIMHRAIWNCCLAYNFVLHRLRRCNSSPIALEAQSIKRQTETMWSTTQKRFARLDAVECQFQGLPLAAGVPSTWAGSAAVIQ